MTSNGMLEIASAKELYSKAYALYESEKYDEVVKIYEILKKTYPDAKETKWAATNFKKCDPLKRVQLKTRKGYALIIASAIWAFLLITRVESVLGHKYFVISGHNVFDQQGISLSNEVFTVFWIVAILTFFVGMRMVTASGGGLHQLLNTEKTEKVITDTKKCPMCAEIVKYEAKKCKHCGHMFETESKD